jgi:hypothetical protein
MYNLESGQSCVEVAEKTMVVGGRALVFEPSAFSFAFSLCRIHLLIMNQGLRLDGWLAKGAPRLSDNEVGGRAGQDPSQLGYSSFLSAANVFQLFARRVSSLSTR